MSPTDAWPFVPYASLHDLIAQFSLDVRGVLHVGARIGEEAEQYVLNQIPGDKVWWVEANPAVIPKLHERVDRYGHHVIEALVLDRDGGEPVDFHVTNLDGLSSSVLDFGTHKEFSKDIHFESHLSIVPRTIDSLVDEYGIQPEVTMLVLDLQGAEKWALAGAERFLRQVQTVVTEVNSAEVYVGCTQFREIDQLLAGFARLRTWWVGDQGWGDALYRRGDPPVRPATFDATSGLPKDEPPVVGTVQMRTFR